MQSPKISVCIPYHQTPDTAKFLARALDSIAKQDYKNYEIILSKEGPFAINHNAAILKATGDIVQMLQMDDFFTGGALTRIAEAYYKDEVTWAISPSLHISGENIGNLHNPEWTDDIHTGNNRLGSVSTLSMRRDKALLFEHPLTWLVDCDLYLRLFLRYGKPTIMDAPNLIIDTRHTRLSSTLSDELKADEVNYLKKKYEH